MNGCRQFVPLLVGQVVGQVLQVVHMTSGQVLLMAEVVAPPWLAFLNLPPETNEWLKPVMFAFSIASEYQTNLLGIQMIFTLLVAYQNWKKLFDILGRDSPISTFTVCSTVSFLF